MKSSKSSAFTLTEMLIVIGILGLLAMLLFPAVGRALEKGGMTADMSNLRQIGLGMAAFAAENNGRIPHSSIPVSDAPAADGSGRPSFMESVDRMMPPRKGFDKGSIYNWQARPIWYSKTYAKKPDGIPFTPTEKVYYWGTAYGMNPFLWAKDYPLGGQRDFNGYINRAPDLSKLVLVGEKNRAGGHDFDPRTTPTFEKNVESNYRISRDGKAFYLFGDYHVELIEGDQSTQTHPEYKTYKPDNRLYYAW